MRARIQAYVQATTEHDSWLHGYLLTSGQACPEKKKITSFVLIVADILRYKAPTTSGFSVDCSECASCKPAPPVPAPS
ncbi:hypothetical protein WJX77_004981 [Trebouxia sp. C0004]